MLAGLGSGEASSWRADPRLVFSPNPISGGHPHDLVSPNQLPEAQPQYCHTGVGAQPEFGGRS